MKMDNETMVRNGYLDEDGENTGKHLPTYENFMERVNGLRSKKSIKKFRTWVKENLEPFEGDLSDMIEMIETSTNYTYNKGSCDGHIEDLEDDLGKTIDDMYRRYDLIDW